MKIEFDQDYLRELFEENKTTNRKIKLQNAIIKQYVKTVNMLRVAESVETLYRFNSLRYEKKSGNMAGREFVRINDQYRLEIRTSIEEPDKITVCTLIEITNHYK